ncbi:nucleotide exchange factor GrpE [Candidatus Woesebacteria bacterium GWA1_41_8]|jgi:molecular chaperone GrpE|uniref:Protein GrpE n=1 Tax=Candidatus Woesebacteria bacterium GWA1_41_8 TaxID=1802471 RepID=A0A1F7WM32_9BACT|nr:MAG: nucleotide exchange factor GrpE [Candidatus Woesebacteria bacterium GWA1_41_8]
MKKTKAKEKFSEKEFGQIRDQLVRALADYDNLRKRVEKEKEQFKYLASLSVIEKLLPVFDMLEEAQKHLQDSGLAITINEFLTVLKEEGIEKIDARKGTKFDEELHEAVEVVSSPGKDGEIVEEVLTGWKFSEGPVIRPAKVKVIKKG